MVTIAERFIFSEVSDPDSFTVSDTWMDEPFPIAYCTDLETAKELAADLNESVKLRARIAELEKEKAELQKDRERLDWLDNNQRGVVAIDCEDERGTTFMGFTAAADWDGPEDGWHKSIRQAIDNAIGMDDFYD